MKDLASKRMLIVDLYSGRYAKEHTGHEDLNLDKNPVDGNYYGYCPPWNNIVITKLGAKKGAEYVDGVTIVYVRKKKNSVDREIIAFCLDARVFKPERLDIGLNRFIEENGEIKPVGYSIKSSNMHDLTNRLDKFEIKIKDYNAYMFRMQRVYGGTYPALDKKIASYLTKILETEESFDDDDGNEQINIQMSEPASPEEIRESAEKQLCFVNGNHGRIVAKDSKISKSALISANYICAINLAHKTFITKNKTPYMEGHHLIPCTVANSEKIWNRYKKNIDCFENIVCLCPNCHREVHYGEWGGKSEKVRILLQGQKDKLQSVGIHITEEELLNLYK